MKKLFSLFAAVLFAGSMMADSYTITFKDNGAGSADATSSLTSTNVADYVAEGADYVSAVAVSGKVYNGQEGYGLKFGNSSNPGSITLTLAAAVTPTSIVMNASPWSGTEVSGLLQDSVYETKSTGAKGSFADFTYNYDGATEVTTIIVGTSVKRGYVKSVTVNYEGGGVTPPATLTEPAAAPAAPTWPANQVKAVYSETYGADCGFGEWGSGTSVAQEEFGKKYVTTNLGYFGLEFGSLNCSQMEALHLDVWIADNASIGIVPIHGGTEVRVTKELVGQQWNSIDIPLSEFAGVENWANVYQIKIDNAANLTFWLNNVYFYTTVAPAADEIAPADFTASLVSNSYFSANIQASATDASGAVTFDVLNGELIVATGNAASGATANITVGGLTPNTAYNFSVVAKDESGNAATPIAVAAQTLAAPAPATAPTYAADKVLALETGAYTNLAYGLQDWWAMPAVVKGNLAANEPALCLLPNATGGSCFGMAFAPTDITAYDALEMDVYPTAEGAKLKIQVIGDNAGLPAATEYTLVANQWNHISLNIKDNTKTNCEQVGFYDCNNLLDACFVQNVLFVDTDEPVALPDPTNCAEAREAALSVSANNELYKDGAVYSITGYVTSIQTAYNDSYHNISFWMADAADGGNVIQAYRAACASADDAPIVGDKVTVTGSLTKYGTTPEFAAACTFVIVEHGTPVVPQNLGEKTIAEFLALANTVDTCVLTGVVTSIVNDTYGNLYLADGNDTLYVYGVLTPAGEAKKFGELNVAVNDTLTVKAVYSLYNNAPQAKNAVFVAVKKAPIEPQEIVLDVEYADAMHITQYGAWQLNLYKDYSQAEGVTYPDFYVILAEKSATTLAGTYSAAAGEIMLVQVFTSEKDSASAVQVTPFVITYKGDGVYNFNFAFLGDDGNTYILDTDLAPGAYEYGTWADIVLEDVAEGIENTEVLLNATKRIENGTLIIERNNVRYNVSGQVVR